MDGKSKGGKKETNNNDVGIDIRNNNNPLALLADNRHVECTVN